MRQEKLSREVLQAVEARCAEQVFYHNDGNGDDNADEEDDGDGDADKDDDGDDGIG